MTLPLNSMECGKSRKKYRYPLMKTYIEQGLSRRNLIYLAYLLPEEPQNLDA